VTVHSAPPQAGDIGLVVMQGDLGRMIRVAQWLDGDGFENFEHAFVYLGDGAIIEAEPGGARRDQLAKYASFDVAWLSCPPGNGRAVADAAQQLMGTPYSFLDYAALAAHRVHFPMPGLRHYISDTGHMICSQLADEAARRGGWHLFSDNRWPGYVTPGALFQLARSLGENGSHVTRIPGPAAPASNARPASRSPHTAGPRT
jgi:hypothetical protein